MKMKKKKWVGVILSLTLVISLVVIGGVPSPALAKGTPSAIKIVVFGPMKIPLGQHQWHGAEIGAEEINAKGGISIKGKKVPIELIKVDDNCFGSVADASTAMVRAITRLKADFLLGGYTTEATIPQMEIAMDHKKIFMAIGTNSTIIGDKVQENYARYKYAFHNQCFSARVESGYYMPLWCEKVAKSVRKGLGWPADKTLKVAVIAEKAAWSNFFVDEFEKPGTYSPFGGEWMSKLNIELVGVWRPARMATNVTAELTAINGKKPHLVAVFTTGPVGVSVSKQLRELEIPALPFACNISAMNLKHWDITGGGCEGLSMFSPYARCGLGEKTISFFDKFEAKVKQWPIYTAATYDALYMIQNAIEKTGSLDPDVLVPVFEKAELSLSLGKCAFNKKHEAKYGRKWIPQPYVQWQAGKLVSVWPDGGTSIFDSDWKGYRPEGTADFLLPSWFIKHWK